jgi:hypothetical protein
LKSKDLKKEKYEKSTTFPKMHSQGEHQKARPQTVDLFVVIYFPMDDIKENGNENGNEELVPFLVDPVSSRHILFWVC